MSEVDEKLLSEKNHEILRLLADRIKADRELAEAERQRKLAIDLRTEEERLHRAETEKLRIATQRHARIVEEILQRYVQAGEQLEALSQLLIQLPDLFNHIFALQEYLEEQSEQVELLSDDLDAIKKWFGRLVEILRTGKRNGQRIKLDTLLKEIDNEPEVKRLRQQITNHLRRLNKLKEQAALKGSNSSPDLLIEIEDIQGKIEHLQQMLVILLGDVNG